MHAQLQVGRYGYCVTYPDKRKNSPTVPIFAFTQEINVHTCSWFSLKQNEPVYKTDTCTHTDVCKYRRGCGPVFSFYTAAGLVTCQQASNAIKWVISMVAFPLINGPFIHFKPAVRYRRYYLGGEY